MMREKSGQVIQEKSLKIKALIALMLLYGYETWTILSPLLRQTPLMDAIPEYCDGLNIPCSLSQVRETVSTSTELTCIEVTCIETTGPVQNFIRK